MMAMRLPDRGVDDVRREDDDLLLADLGAGVEAHALLGIRPAVEIVDDDARIQRLRDAKALLHATGESAERLKRCCHRLVCWRSASTTRAPPPLAMPFKRAK
jgi:hypothetical protein